MKFKRYIKKGLVTFAILSIITPSIASSVNADSVHNKENNGVKLSNSIHLNKPSKDVTISKVMTYDEIIKEIADNENITLEKAEELIENESWIPYDVALKDMVENGNIPSQKAKEILSTRETKETRSGTLVRANTYRTLTKTVTVTSAYKPTINWYCSTSESGNYHGIVKILRTSLNRSYNGVAKQFAGDLYSKLERSDCIYYELNGDFYNNGTTTISGTGSAELSGYGSVGFSVSYASNHYKYCFITGRRTW